jgi:predicted nucleic acid-binding protein
MKTGYLLDTNVVSELRKRSPHPGVTQWYRELRADSLFLSVLTIGEIRNGIERLRSRDQQAAVALDTWLRFLQRIYGGRVIPVDTDVSQAWGRLNVRRPLPVIDGLLAATALVHGLTFVTCNVKDIVGSGVTAHNPLASMR